MNERKINLENNNGLLNDEVWEVVKVKPFPADYIYPARGLEGVVGGIGVMGLMETLRNGGAVEIPSLKIRLISDTLEKKDE